MCFLTSWKGMQKPLVKLSARSRASTFLGHMDNQLRSGPGHTGVGILWTWMDRSTSGTFRLPWAVYLKSTTSGAHWTRGASCTDWTCVPESTSFMPIFYFYLTLALERAHKAVRSKIDEFKTISYETITNSKRQFKHLRDSGGTARKKKRLCIV